MKIWINNKVIDVRKAKISVFDRGFLYGDGLFETMRSYNGRVFKLDSHLARLFDSAKILKIKMPYSKTKLKKAIYKILAVNSLKDASIRLTMTRGEGGFILGNTGQKLVPNVMVTAKNTTGYPADFYSRGISACVSDVVQDERSSLCGAKTLNFLSHIMARLEAEERGFDEAILLNTKGQVAEASASNIFLVRNGTITTPSFANGILAGITRCVVIHIAKALGIKIEEKCISRKDLRRADEIFLTSSIAELLPVVKIDGSRVGAGIPGPITKLLHASYKKMI